MRIATEIAERKNSVVIWKKRPLLVGQGPSRTGVGCRPFRGRPGRFLASLAGISEDELFESLDAINLLDEYHGKDGKGDEFPAGLARMRAAFLEPVLDGRLVVAAGRKVAAALGSRGRCWFEVFPVRSHAVVAMPHPSGINLWYWYLFPIFILFHIIPYLITGPFATRLGLTNNRQSFRITFMLKAHRKFREPTMRRTSRIFLPWLNVGKIKTLSDFLRRCRDIIQYYIDFFWQRGDFTPVLASTDTIHQATERFNITSRLAQAIAKQAKEIVRSAEGKSRPNIHNPTITLDSRFIAVEKFTGSFDYAVKLTGSGAPKMVIPLKSTEHMNRKIADGWQIGKTVRMGLRRNHVFIDLILEKPRPKLKKTGEVMGIDSNYKAGITTSRDEFIGGQAYTKIQTFSKRQKHTFTEAKNVVFNALKSLDLKGVKTLVIENLKRVRHGTRPRNVMNKNAVIPLQVASNRCSPSRLPAFRYNPRHFVARIQR